MTSVQYQRGAIEASDCIGSAWTLVTRNFFLYIGGCIVLLLLLGCIPVLNWILFGPMMGGFYYLVLRDMRDEPVDFGMLFKGFDKFLPLMVVGLIQIAPSIVVTILQYASDVARLVGGGMSRGTGADFYATGDNPFMAGLSIGLLVVVIVLSLLGAVWSVALSFAVPLVLEHGMSVGDALLTSAKAAGSNIGGLILLIILEVGVFLLGVIALCFGIFVAMPVIYAANVIAYRQVFPYFQTNYQNVPPPPDTYGNFGRT